MAVELPTGYYLSNFLELIDHVADQYGDLLSAEELAFHRDFHQLGEAPRKLLVRMMTRRGEAFRHSKLQYAEISDTGHAARELRDAGFVEDSASVPVELVIPLFSKPEWLRLLSELDLDRTALAGLRKLRRPDLDSALLELSGDHDLRGLIDEPVYRLTNAEVFETFKLLFFGNLYQDLTEFVLRDLGLYRFEDYRIDREARLFASREQIEHHLHYYQTVADIEDVLTGPAEELLALHARLPEPAPDDPVLIRRVQRTRVKLARQLERIDALEESLPLYEQCHLPLARERRARILARQEQVDAALTLCREILDAPIDESEAVFADGFGYRTARKFRRDWEKPDTYQPEQITLSLKPTGDSVETVAALHFQQFGACHYLENALFNSIFGLHYWELLFAPVRGAFTNPFQMRPHDLYESDFLQQRQTLWQQLEQKLPDINDNADHYLEMWQDKFGITTPFVFWHYLDEALIRLALQRIPAAHWQAIFTRMWSDIRNNRAGFPDLILFPDDGGYELIEVKGPGDRLQKNQLRWMRHFHRHDIPHKVVHVEWC